MPSDSTIPLTTIFTPPSDCLSSWTYEPSTYNEVTSGLLLQNAFQSSLDSSCFPSGFSQAGRGAQNVVFSPGACPHGYTTNSPATTVALTTTASCCLSGYYYTSTSGYQGCIGTYTGTTFLAARAGGFNTTDYTTSTTVSGTIQMWAQPITIMYQASQETLYTTATTAPSTSAATSALSPTLSPSTLSGGAKAGIAVGSVVGVLLLIGLAYIFWRIWRKKKIQEEGRSNNTQEQVLAHNYAMTAATLSELDYRSTRAELEGPAVQTKVVPGYNRTFEVP
ncbi:uncharacterized protein N7482_003587 [Penicillium canariense]|uniref:Uncharacterized protein n=1 Tax=Penicillium canariense TaxID=189055 RepID=A0A9W9LPR2_9EURO|nr:uncharacterized protein N7482_003587 [Penicillium canariense]KAJ5167993.1 hypothetical protein N7482_003587 [Penicillium canariense]